MKKRIVVADDDPTIVTLVSLRLEADDYEVCSAPTGDEALKAIRARPTDAAILDVQMPGTGGLAILEQIKSDPAIAGMPVMMLTGERNPETVMQALGSGAADYMVKPFDPDTLVRRLERMIRNHPAPERGAAPAWEI
jgi:two-component system phosphate regulon response regulator PhoB